MESEVISDLAELEPYFAKELSTLPSVFSVTAAMWPVVSQRVKDALEADIIDAGYTLRDVMSVEYCNGKIVIATVRIR